MAVVQTLESWSLVSSLTMKVRDSTLHQHSAPLPLIVERNEPNFRLQTFGLPMKAAKRVVTLKLRGQIRLSQRIPTLMRPTIG
jgi:hypothetical protein